MRVKDIQFQDQRTLTLMLDVVLLIEQSELNSVIPVRAACARASVDNSVLLIECISNSCLFSLDLPSKLLEELDKLPPLSKLDYYLFSLASKHIDRGCRAVELAADILKLRDHLVHPKPKKGNLVSKGEQQTVCYGKTKCMNIPLDTREWNTQIAASIAGAVADFLRLFFLEWCGFGKSNVTSLLMLREKALIRKEISSWVVVPDEDIALLWKWVPQFLEVFDIRAKSDSA